MTKTRSKNVYRLAQFYHLTGIGLLLATILTTTETEAQLSPGELHRAHAFLEGVDNCGKCHSRDRSNLSSQCLACHTAIKQRQNTGKGLHASPGYQDCELCHVEHQGQDFALIYFKGGQDSFNHSQTGYVLQGSHAQLNCRQCHRREHLVNPEGLAEQSVAVDRTFLGLDTVCLSCHTDQHRGQLTNDCSRCHSFDHWQPAAGFNHNRAQFALTGRHAMVACEKCHPRLTDNSVSGLPFYVMFRPIAHDNCTNCHRDSHQGRLGDNCVGCHTTSGWRQMQAADFDHDRTRYPLRGRHAALDCRKCHTNDSGKKQIRFARCLDCHSDYHAGAFADRAEGGACEECHTVGGFRPAIFTLTQHDQTDYPLLGAHRAIGCNRCHRVDAANSYHYVFDFASSRCVECHRDPHRGEVDRWLKTDGCGGCHTVQDWDFSRFDHSKTEFMLTGQHKIASCRACHMKGSDPAKQLSFVSTETACSDCHRNVHGNQFVLNDDGAAACERCHTTDNWQANRFDHSRDSRFVLDGVHARLACSSCHRSEHGPDGQSVFIRYKPLDTACASCHSNSTFTGKADL